MSKEKIDLAIIARWIIPVVPRNRIFEDCALLINEEKIHGIVPVSELEANFEAKDTLRLDSHALMPGLINCHSHAAMSLLRGYADDKPLMTWLEDHIWPAEAQWVSESFVEDGTELAIAEMLLSGTTCFSDMYFFPEVSAKVALDSGIRAQIAFPILDFPTAWGSGPEEYLEKGLKLHDEYRSIDRISIAFGPHAPYTVSDEPLQKISMYAEELQLPVQIHLHETEFEVEQSLSDRGERPSQRLHQLGLISPLSQCVHMTQINELDIELLKQNAAHVVHCPDSNLKLASGLCPIQSLLENNINVCLGTDGAASNNDLNLFNEMQQAALLAKYESKNAEAVDAMTALEIATINGAKAMGIADKTGSLEAGKYADLCAVDLSGIQFQPIYNPISQLVYSNAGSAVTDVWVGGKHLVKRGELSTLNQSQILKNAKTWAEKIAQPELRNN